MGAWRSSDNPEFATLSEGGAVFAERCEMDRLQNDFSDSPLEVCKQTVRYKVRDE